MDIKGVILVGGKGTRLQPATFAMNKHMIPILNKPMILYPLETLTKVFGMKDILIISGDAHIGAFADFFGDGSAYGTSLTYRVQNEARGIAQALSLARDFVGNNRSIVILGDNVFDNDALARDVDGVNSQGKDAIVFYTYVGEEEARRFGVPSFVQADRKIISHITEKPANPDSYCAITGLYSYPPDVFDRIASLSPSQRGELEITDLNNLYAKETKLRGVFLNGFWSDAGTPASLARTTAWAASV